MMDLYNLRESIEKVSAASVKNMMIKKQLLAYQEKEFIFSNAEKIRTVYAWNAVDFHTLYIIVCYDMWMVYLQILTEFIVR